jgi:hypothetical protein
MNMEIGLWPRNSFPGNICFEFSVLVLCSVRGPTYNLLYSNYIYYRPHKMCYYKGQRLGLAWPLVIIYITGPTRCATTRARGWGWPGLGFRRLPTSNYIYYRPHKMCYYKGQRLGLAWPRLQEAPFAESLASILLQPR